MSQIQSKMKTKNVTIIGAGNVGAHIASNLIHRNLAININLLDLDEKFEAAQVLDLRDMALYSPHVRINGANFGQDNLADSDIVVITAGAKQSSGETRCDLLGRNVKILQSIKNNLGGLNKNCVILLVSNPVDIMTSLAQKIFDLPKRQILGTGTSLDTARLRWRLAKHFETSIDDVDGYVLAEHGDSEFVAWSSVERADEIADEDKVKMAEKTKQAAYEIIEGKGATYFGIGASSAQIIEFILTDKKAVIPVSVDLEGQHECMGVAVGYPSVIGRSGVESTLDLKLTAHEEDQLQASCTKLKDLFLSCEI